MRLTSSLCTKLSLPDPKRPNRRSSINSHHPNAMQVFILFTFVLAGSLAGAAYHPDINIQQPPSIFKGPGYEQLFQVLRDQTSDRSDKPFSLEVRVALSNPKKGQPLFLSSNRTLSPASARHPAIRNRNITGKRTV